MWWDESRGHHNPEEKIRIILANKKGLKNHLSELDGKKVIYRGSHRLFTVVSRIAGIADMISVTVQRVLQKLPLLRVVIGKIRAWKNNLNFRELIEFLRTKLYSFRRPPHNEKAISTLEEIIEFGEKHGLDIDAHIPRARKRLREKKNEMLQHKFFQEFSKSILERVLATQFSFDRNIYPVLPDSSFWHKVFALLENIIARDIILVNRNNERVSFKHDTAAEIASTDVIRILERTAQIKKDGHRVFFIGHHEGYLGPYFVRCVIRKLGFDNLTKNCNTVVGPRMFSNVVLRNGALNGGNLFVTVPSQKTTSIKTIGLAEELRKIAARTRCFIKMPDTGLAVIEKLDYRDFMRVMVHGDREAMKQYTKVLGRRKIRELEAFLAGEKFSESMKDLKQEDYDLFREIMHECFLIFPEGSRSNIDPDGSVVMKYVSPKYMQAYMRPGDFIVPVNLVGGSDITRGWRLRPATLGLSLDDPFEVTPAMLENYEKEALNVMRKIARLPNIKKVYFKEETQFKRKNNHRA